MFRAALSHDELHSLMRLLDGKITICETDGGRRNTVVHISELSTDVDEPTLIVLPQADE